jgi:hypothetical protein
VLAEGCEEVEEVVEVDAAVVGVSDEFGGGGGVQDDVGAGGRRCPRRVVGQGPAEQVDDDVVVPLLAAAGSFGAVDGIGGVQCFDGGPHQRGVISGAEHVGVGRAADGV